MRAIETVLIISARFNRGLTEAVYKKGFIPLVYSDMELALFAMRRTGFKAVLINGQDNRIDVLETVLNLKDINPEIPIIIVGLSPDDEIRKIPQKISDVFFIINSDEEIGKKLSQL